jgi:hypothetical protein
VVRKGDRVRMTGIMPDDPAPMEVGAEGTVEEVTESVWLRGYAGGGQIMVKWDNGRSLILLPTDPFIVLPPEPTR